MPVPVASDVLKPKSQIVLWQEDDKEQALLFKKVLKANGCTVVMELFTVERSILLQLLLPNIWSAISIGYNTLLFLRNW